MITLRVTKFFVVFIVIIAASSILVSCSSGAGTLSGEFRKTNTIDQTTTQAEQSEIITNVVTPQVPSVFEVISYKFTNDLVYVPAFTYATATISGGNIGEYTLYIVQETVGGTAQLPPDPATEITFYHDGAITTITTPFPDHPYPNDGIFLMKIFYDKDCKWIQPDDNSRLTLIHWGWNED